MDKNSTNGRDADLIAKLDEAIAVREVESERLQTEMNHLRATRNILAGTPVHQPPEAPEPGTVTAGDFLHSLIGDQAEVAELPPWTEMALDLIYELPTPFRMADMHSVLELRGYELDRQTVSSWLSRTHKDRGLIVSAGKKGLWMPVTEQE